MSRSHQEAPHLSCGEVGDIMANVNRFIHIGVATDYPPALDKAKQLLIEVRGEELGSRLFEMMVADEKQTEHNNQEKESG